MSTSCSQTLVSKYAPGSTRELLMMALPLMISYGSQSLMQFVDRMFLTWYSQSALAATMPAGLLVWTIISLAYGVASYTGTFVAQYEGAGHKERVVSVVWQAVWLSLIFGSLLACTAFFAPAIFAQLDHPPEVQKAEVTYFSTLMVGAPLMLLLTSLSGFFSGRNQTAVVMWVNMTAVVLNLVLDYVLIFGWGPIPELGILGAGLATILANLVAVMLFAVLVVLTCRWQNYPLWARFTWDGALGLRMIKYGIPMGTQIFVDIAGFTVFAFVIGKAGVNALAATNLAFNLNSLAFIPMAGLGVAVMTLVGRRVGEGTPKLAETTVNKALVLAMSYMGFWCIAYLLFPHQLISPFRAFAEGTEFAATEEIIVVLLRFVALYGLFDAVGLIYAYAIRGAGDAWFPLLIFFVSSLLFLVIPAVLIWYYLDGNLYACWTAATLYIVVIGVSMYLRYHSRAWQKMRVIESAEELEKHNQPAPLEKISSP